MKEKSLKAIVIVSSYHQKNTEKVAQRIAAVLGCRVSAPQQTTVHELSGCDLIGFGSGIYNAKHDLKLLALADILPRSAGTKVFLFSTDGMPRFIVRNEKTLMEKMRRDHTALREKLQAKGYNVIGEFGCAGFNTNSFLKKLGGLNKGHPDANDLAQAETFACGLITAMNL